MPDFRSEDTETLERTLEGMKEDLATYKMSPAYRLLFKQSIRDIKTELERRARAERKG